MNFNKTIVCLLYYLQLLRLPRTSSAFFWNWIVTNPHATLDVSPSSLNILQDPKPLDISDDDRFKLSHSRNQREKFLRIGQNLDFEDPEVLTASADREALARTNKVRCFADRDCDSSANFCDLHYQICKPQRSEGEGCRADSHCTPGLHCMYGRCFSSPMPGQRGARCSSDKDCAPSLCCARQHGERICKPKLRLGENCFVPEGGLSYSLNELCPCESSLICDRHSRSDSMLASDRANVRKDRNKLRCVRP